MSEINPTDHKSITASHFSDEGFRGTVRELDNKLPEAELSILRDCGQSKRHYSVLVYIMF